MHEQPAEIAAKVRALQAQIAENDRKYYGDKVCTAKPTSDGFIPVVADRTAPEPVNSFDSMNAAQLLATDFGELRWLIDGLLHEGFGLLIAPPKTGKSWWGTDLCISIAIGEDFWGHCVTKCGTLYLALEDSFRRVQGRVRKLLNGRKPPENFHTAITARAIDDGFVAQVDTHMQKHPDTGLIVLDILQRVRSKGGRRSRNAYEFDSDEMSKFKAIADKHNVLFLAVHHDSKQKLSADPMSHISGSNGIAGAADIALIMAKEDRMSTKATLTIISREMGDKQLEVEFNKDTCKWDLIGEVEEVTAKKDEDIYNSDPVVITIKALLKDNPGGFERTAGEFLLDMTALTQTCTKQTPTSLGRYLPNIAHKLYLYDSIRYIKCTGAKRRFHSFRVDYGIHIINKSDISVIGDTSVTSDISVITGDDCPWDDTL